MDPQILSIVNVVYLLSFVVLLVLALSRMLKRGYDYTREGLPLGLILKRDIFFFAGLAVPFLGVLIFRAFGIVASEQWWYALWVIASGAFALSGTLFWVYVEYFKIDR